jgi:pilus assembly protein CpaB
MNASEPSKAGGMIEPRENTDPFRRASVVSLVVFAAVLSTPRGVERGRATGRLATVPVVVAAKDMPDGVTVDRLALVVAQWPAGTQPAGAYDSVDSVAGRATWVPVYKGEAIVSGKLAPKGTSTGIEVTITPGKRAYGIRVNDVSSLAGMVQPGSRVDIMVVVNDRAGGKQVAKLFMENMRVLAIAAATERPRDGRPIQAAVASIEVTPTEAERLAIAQNQGQMALVLRGYSDPDSMTSSSREQVPVRDLLLRKSEQWRHAPSVSPRKAARPDSFALKVFPGTTKAEQLRFAKDSAAAARPIRNRP